MKRIIICIGDWLDTRLRRFCGKMNQTSRIIVLAGMIILYLIGSLFMFGYVFYQIGKKNARNEISIQHITCPELLLNTIDSKTDHDGKKE